ncbi:MAG: anacyclamide/piricyclamide family prenylated cyclic peptide [Oscillatoria princeps RMCB-10]|jgi:prenylated cyclic peptide (anacyclamide/piricyclamide family)|nr:anacyclamide/piricyclamide family prenylated cyclic peptide [Oscillatoria princeps RMCB-10]
MKNKTVMPKQAAPVERNSPATAGAEKGVVACVTREITGFPPFAGDDAE